MTDFLDEIVHEMGSSLHSPGYLDGLPLQPQRRPSRLSEALARSLPPRVLAEFKRRSPGSATPDLPVRAPAEFASLAKEGGAVALSCVACRPRFGGSPQDVAHLTSSSPLPVLFKDFVTEPVQVEAARRAGAAAILLITRLETERRSRARLAELAEFAHQSGLEVVLEVHRPEELKIARQVRAEVFGINQRDLATLAMRPEVARETLRLSSDLRPRLLFSGITSRADVERWEYLGADGCLVGSAVSRAADPAAFLRSLNGRAPGASG